MKTHTDGTKEKVPCRKGKRGIVTVAKILKPVVTVDQKPEVYTRGNDIWWRWMAETHEEVTTGFVAAADVKRILKYKKNYNFRGFGKLHSGVKQLTQEQCDSLLEIFRRSQPPVVVPRKVARRRHRTPGGGEGPEHRLLKNFVADRPSTALQEKDLRTLATEYQFPCSDRADVVLVDNMNRPIGVEVEVEQEDSQLDGLLQAVKYRHMLAVMHSRPFRETRAVLVAHKLGPKIKRLCRRYEVQAVEVKREDVISGPSP